jgi:hypothetical protein
MGAKSGADRFIGIDVPQARVDMYVRPEATAFYCATDTDGLVRWSGG